MLTECVNCLTVTEFKWLDCDHCRELGVVCDDYECLGCGGVI